MADQSLKFCQTQDVVEQTAFNGYMRLEGSKYPEECRVEREEETPEGYLLADHVFWNVEKTDLVDYVSGLADGPRYKVLIVESN